MLTLHEQATIRQLIRENISPAEIARKTGRSIGAIYKYKKVFEDQPLVKELLHKETSNYKRAVRIETPAGNQAQVDWGTFGSILINGKKEPLYAFLFILSYSRKLYVEFTIRQNQTTLQECHINAFEALGIPETIYYDNMKTVVISHKRRRDDEPLIVYNTAFLDFARYYDFTVKACPPYWPRTKGKVEASVKYLRSAFIPTLGEGVKYQSLEELNVKLKAWLEDVAHKRIHRTTGKSPDELYQHETQKLQKVGVLPRYQTSLLEFRRSTKDGMLSYKGSMYSVPMRYAGKKLTIRDENNRGDKHIVIYRNNEKVAEHVQSQTKGRWVLDPRHHLDENPMILKSTKQPHKIKRPEIIVEVRPNDYYDSLLGR